MLETILLIIFGLMLIVMLGTGTQIFPSKNSFGRYTEVVRFLLLSLLIALVIIALGGTDTDMYNDVRGTIID